MPARRPVVRPGPGIPPTIADVAREAAVSKTTASDALRGHGRVAEPTRRLVLEAAERLGYAPNRSARSLRTLMTETIALHVPEFLDNAEYGMSFVFGVAEQAARAGLNVTLIPSGRLPDRHATVPQADGLVLCDPMARDPVVERLMSNGLPVVTAECQVGDPRVTGIVRSDHDTAMTQLLDHLHESGARRPAFVASGTTGDRALTLQRAHARWCAERGLPALVGEAPSGSPPEVLRNVVRDLLSGAPETDAILCAADSAAAAVLPEVRAAGRVVGENLLLASCVDSQAMRTAEPPITALDLRPRETGAECARLLCEIISGETPRGTTRTLPVELICRASTRAR
ncbi:LacI family DNA-binding transcriptional regulator [Streptomyces sp. NPDC090106]|uniref:LacI family DNA-binding transcriptional regulator n=1 Tax=Streptomyces sp. NPDC090106 TaxID=3365946 RepID=UPI00381C8174